MSEYTEQAERFLEEFGFKLTIKEGVGECPKWGHENGCGHGDQYRVVIRRMSDGQAFRWDWWGSLAMLQRGDDPTSYDVLSSLGSEAHSPTDPDEVAEEFGPIPPSQAIAVARFARRLQAFFTEAELEALGEIQ